MQTETACVSAISTGAAKPPLINRGDVVQGRAIIVDATVASETGPYKIHTPARDWMSRRPRKAILLPEAVLQVIRQGVDAVRERRPIKAEKLACWADSIAGSMQVVPAGEIREILDAMMATKQLKPLYIPDPRATRCRIPQALHVAATAIVKQLPIASLMTNAVFATIHVHFPLPGVFNPMTAEWTIGGGSMARSLNGSQWPAHRARARSIQFGTSFDRLPTSALVLRSSTRRPIGGIRTSKVIPLGTCAVLMREKPTLRLLGFCVARRRSNC